MTATEDRMGEIITFYSYKGGTGRSMALVNVACRLASIQSSIEGKGVLMIDWDLEAPGLHTFFRKRFEKLFAPNKNYEAELKLKPGLIDLFIKLDKAAYSNDEAQTEEIANILIEESQPENFILATDINSLHLLKAGRFDGDYKRRVNRFQWVALYNRSPLLISAFARYLSQRYRYILIDSRTGITDIAGICTTLMPEKLVTVFTPNRQSLEGLDELVRQATKYRRQSDDLRPLAVFPLASRIEQREPELGKWWRFGAADQDIPGYQPLFQDLFKEVYDLSDCDLGDYFKEVQVQHVAYYSYGENIAVLSETQPDRLSLPASYDTFVKELIDRPVPWKYQELSEIQSITNELSKRAEEAYALLSLDNQEVARRILTRLVRLTEVGEGGEDHSLRIPIRELDPEEILVAEVLAKARLILTNDGYVELAEEGLVREWRRLGNWIRADRDFLLWRQSLRSDIARWSDSKEHPSTLLTGNSLERAKRKLRERKSYLNDQERSYITLSETFETRQREKKVIKVIAALLLVCVIGVGLYLGIQKLRQSSKSTADVYLSLANTLLERKEYDEAIKNYDQAIKLDHNLPKAYYYRGLAYDQKGDAAMAEASYKEAIERRPDFPEPYKALGLLYFRKRDYDRAIDNLKRVVDLEPQNAEAYSNLAKAYLESNDATQAATYYKSAIQTMPDFAEAHVGLGDALARLNNFDQAIESFTKAITINSRLAEAYYHRGQAYEAKEQNSAALADYDLSLELKPNFADAYLKRADFYFKRWADQKDRNDLEWALSDYERAGESDKTLAAAYFGMGQIFALQKDHESAINSFARVIQLKPDDPEAYLQRGLSYQQLNKHDQAIQDFNKAIELRPDYVEAYYNRGVSYRAKGNDGSAISDFRKVLQLTNDEGIQEKTRLALKQLGFWEPTPANKTVVDIHSENAADSGVVDLLKAALEEKRYVVHKIPPSGQNYGTGIRYFNEEDKQNAQEIQNIVESIVKKENSNINVKAGFFPKLRRSGKSRLGSIEVLLPALTSSSPSPAK